MVRGLFLTAAIAAALVTVTDATPLVASRDRRQAATMTIQNMKFCLGMKGSYVEWLKDCNSKVSRRCM